MADLVVVGTAVLQAAGYTPEHGIAGETLTQGMSVYLKAADTRFWKCTCASAVLAACKGVTLNSAVAGQPITIITAGSYNPGVAVVVGLQYGVTDTGGGIGVLSERGSADYITLIGIATTTSNIVVTIKKSGSVIA